MPQAQAQENLTASPATFRLLRTKFPDEIVLLLRRTTRNPVAGSSRLRPEKSGDNTTRPFGFRSTRLFGFPLHGCSDPTDGLPPPPAARTDPAVRSSSLARKHNGCSIPFQAATTLFSSRIATAFTGDEESSDGVLLRRICSTSPMERLSLQDPAKKLRSNTT
ncbi:hypothetical protein Droror1_Dr00013492 [Drosera rotundifolia]